MSTSASPTKTMRANVCPPPPARREPQSALTKAYRLVATPVAFVAFLVSLALVDLHYSLVRARDAGGDAANAGWPRRLLLHALRGRRPGQPDQLYQQQQQRAAAATAAAAADGPGGGGNGWYYRTMQRKLMRMEACEAFEIRGAVLLVMGLLGAAVAWAAWLLFCWGFGMLTGRREG